VVEEMVKVEVGEEMVKVEVEDTHQVHALQSMKPRLWRWPLPLQ
jgi:4-hydroxy-3-methylbut-2-en-1-yl diphosphate synthase IspG/GcpE